jgi:hypothetical protein
MRIVECRSTSAATTQPEHVSLGGNSDAAEHGLAECSCGISLHAGEDVLVDGHGEGGAAVAEAFADDLHGYAGVQQDAGVGVAQVV